MIYFTSDLHFNHDRDFIYQPRGFESIVEHDETVIKNFHSIVQPEDDLYILGDIMLGDNKKGMYYFNQLPGNLHLIWGNHDTENRKEIFSQCNRLPEILGYGTLLKYKKFHFYLSHYPTLTGNFDDKNSPLYKTVINLSGHTHSKDKFNSITGSYNVALDAHNCYPVSIEDILNDIKTKKGVR